MGMPTEPILDIMRRSMANLRFVDQATGPDGPFEVTQPVVQTTACRARLPETAMMLHSGVPT